MPNETCCNCGDKSTSGPRCLDCYEYEDLPSDLRTPDQDPRVWKGIIPPEK